MTWLKKNLFLVAGGSAALGLLGVAIFFLLTNKQAVDEVTTQLTAQTDDLKKLAIRDPYPNQENIDAAKTEQKKVGAFLQETRRFFVPAANFTTMDSEGFKTLLETTISEMVRDAEKSGGGAVRNCFPGIQRRVGRRARGVLPFVKLFRGEEY